jgi:hypothetical protein
MRLVVMVVLAAGAALHGDLAGQVSEPGPELTAIVAGLNLNSSVGESSVGLGLRAGYRLSPYVALEGEYAYFPENPAGNYGYSLALAGVAAGGQSGRLRYAATLRPGLIRFGGTVFRSHNHGSHTNLAIGLGLALTQYLHSPLLLRLDVGDLIVPFGDTELGVPIVGGTIRPGTTHNRHVALGVGIRL